MTIKPTARERKLLADNLRLTQQNEVFNRHFQFLEAELQNLRSQHSGYDPIFTKREYFTAHVLAGLMAGVSKDGPMSIQRYDLYVQAALDLAEATLVELKRRSAGLD
jgi:hypothetical protein